ncbi:RNA-directed DNA polymerase, eukaryota, reverse transcriptase zinc-binding domain protein [Tanacetum coccineum]
MSIASQKFPSEESTDTGIVDGYTACFFKNALSVIGNEVCLAVKEFFRSGKLLKEVNSTLIALIPKVHHPKFVIEFRSIACCNVLYKNISKILTNRIKGCLSNLVNLNQSAFIQGRNIQDNILLTNKLLKGYDRKGSSKRCALKIDIAKAYDTVNWEFIRNVLIKSESVKVIKDSIDEFSRVSGLEPNLNKSTIYFRNVNIGNQRSILNVLPFKVGKFLVKYLGVPLITKRLGRDECKQLIDKVRNKIPKGSIKGSFGVKGILLEGKLKLLGKPYVNLNAKEVWDSRIWENGMKFCLPNIFGILLPIKKAFRYNSKASVADVISNNQWIWKEEWGSTFPDLNNIQVPTLTYSHDKAM